MDKQGKGPKNVECPEPEYVKLNLEPSAKLWAVKLFQGGDNTFGVVYTKRDDAPHITGSNNGDLEYMPSVNDLWFLKKLLSVKYTWPGKDSWLL